MVGWHYRLSGHELSKLQVLLKDQDVWHAAVHGVGDKVGHSLVNKQQ